MFELRAAGVSQQETADELGIAVGTVNQLRIRASKRRAINAQLSGRQRQVVTCLALGLPLKDVASHLTMAPRTATNHRAAALLSLNLTSVVELTHYAISKRWVRAGDALSPERKHAALEEVTTGMG